MMNKEFSKVRPQEVVEMEELERVSKERRQLDQDNLHMQFELKKQKKRLKFKSLNTGGLSKQILRWRRP